MQGLFIFLRIYYQKMIGPQRAMVDFFIQNFQGSTHVLQDLANCMYIV